MSEQKSDGNQYCYGCLYYYGPPIWIGWGVCRRNPPTNVGTKKSGKPIWEHPTVSPLNWCGEFQKMKAA